MKTLMMTTTQYKGWKNFLRRCGFNISSWRFFAFKNDGSILCSRWLDRDDGRFLEFVEVDPSGKCYFMTCRPAMNGGRGWHMTAYGLETTIIEIAQQNRRCA